MADTTLHVALVWHMHQPSYRDAFTGVSDMPWVRLHATKGYYDMPLILEECDLAAATFNLTPVLVQQIQLYQEGKMTGTFLTLSRKPAGELDETGRAFALRNFFLCNWDTMIRPYPGYARLLSKRGTRIAGVDFIALQRRFSEAEFRDLLVWFNLTWFGPKALERFPELKELRRKDRNFSEEDQTLVLDRQMQILAELVPLYRRLQDAGRAELTTSPFYHPILPLLCDTEFARRDQPQRALPQCFAHPEDAKAQVERAVRFHAEIFGRPAQGMWPSEGSVCPELIPIWAEAGLQWVATDEDILFRSVPALNRADVLFKPYRAVHQGREIAIVFRDRGLADLIGFNYSKMRPEAAVSDFLGKLAGIRDAVAARGQAHALCAVILDGENPWEYFPDSGLGFLQGIYRGIPATPGLALTTPGQYLREHPPQDAITRLYTGSWISHNFNIWIGEPEENKAWDYVSWTRHDLERLAPQAPAAALEQARESLFAAEGSDWFWWFGDDFACDTKKEFDQIFRNHLKNVYRFLGQTPPLFLDEPVRFERARKLAEEPLGLISPILDGEATSFYEWQEAGHLNLDKIQGAMHQTDSLFSHIYFGFDLKLLFLRLDPREGEEFPPELSVRVHFLQPVDQVLHFPFRAPARFTVRRGEQEITLPTIAANKIIELSVPFQDLDFKPGDAVTFVVEVFSGGQFLDRYPRDGFISFTAPDESFESKMWSV